MRVVFVLRVLAVCIAGICAGRAADELTAREIVDATAKAYHNVTCYQVQALSRSVRMIPIPSGGPRDLETTPRYGVSVGAYVQLSLKLRKPNDWSLAVQTQSSAASRATLGKQPVTQSGPSTTFNSIARWADTPPQRGRMQDERFEAKALPLAEFTNEVRALLPKNVRELVLGQFEPPSGGFSTARPFKIVNPERIDDPEGDPALYRIKGKTSSGDDVVVWIEKARFLVTKSLVYNRENMAGPGAPAGGDSRMPSRVMIVMQETIYRSQENDLVFQAEDFQLQTPMTLGPIDTEAQDWTSQAALVALANNSPVRSGAEGVVSGEAEVSFPPSANAVVDAQALTQDQMAGLVLIEGDAGTATGFMTKIRDVDFVVTNLHVLQGNKKFSLKTLRGEEIPMLAVFGAVGSDIAIIRINGGQGDLKLAKDVFSSSKIGDKVVVVGNRLGGGVATQTAGSIVGVGPTRVEVNANFQPGNSGSPIVNLGTNEVVGVATYAETRRVDVEDRAPSSSGSATTTWKVEKRWFGYRLDSVAKWEAIDLAKWRAQDARIDKFRETSEALHAFIRFDFKTAREHPRLTSLLDAFESRFSAASTNGITAATEVKDLFRVIRTISDDGVRDLTSGDYYDYFRTCLYWESSIPAQLEYRQAIVEVLKRYEANSNLYVSRLRGN